MAREISAGGVVFREIAGRWHVALIEPQTPPNTGNLMRLCAGADVPLHLIGPLAFDVDGSEATRAERREVRRHRLLTEGAGDLLVPLLVIDEGELVVRALDVHLAVDVTAAVVQRPQRVAVRGAEHLVVHEVHVDSGAGDVAGALLRRGIATLNSRWTPAATVLTGDFIFARAARLAADTNSVPVMQLFAQTLATIVDGELTQLFSSHRIAFSLSPAHE